MATYDELHHFDGTGWNPQSQGVAPVSASQMIGGPATTPLPSAMTPASPPPSTTSDSEIINNLANNPNGAAVYGAHADSVHKAAQMRLQGGFDKLKYPTVTEREKNELADNTRANSAAVAAKASQNGSIGVGQALDIMSNTRAIDDSTAQAAKAKLYAPNKKGH